MRAIHAAQDSCPEAPFLAHGFPSGLIKAMVTAGHFAIERHNMRAGGRVLPLRRLRITLEGRLVVGAMQPGLSPRPGIVVSGHGRTVATNDFLAARAVQPRSPRHPRRRMNNLRREKSIAMKIDRIQPPGMNVRIQQGKPAYSHVVTVTGPGKTIYIAGQLARDREGNIVGPGDMRAQLEQTFKNLEACLKAAGATWADVVKTNTFVTDYQAFSQCSDVRMRYFGIASPTSTTIQISGLAQPEAMVEIEMVAVVE